MKVIIYILLINIIISCGVSYKNRMIEASIVYDFLNTNNKPTKSIRKDGLYNTFDTLPLSTWERNDLKNESNKYVTNNDLIFINSKNCEYNYNGASYDSSNLTLKNYDNILIPNHNYINDYVITGDSIKAYISIGLNIRGMRNKHYKALFQGIIKNQDTILNWQMVKPYPKIKYKFNDIEELIRPKLLYFMESKELLGLEALYQRKLDSLNLKNKK